MAAEQPDRPGDAVATETRPPAETATAPSPYPRRGPVRWLRAGLLLCWALIVLYTGSAGFNLWTLAHDDLSVLLDWEKVRPALTLPGPMDSATTPLWVDAVSGLIFLALLAGCIWATWDLRAEDRQDLHTTIGGHVQHVLRQGGFQLTPPARPATPGGPPFDDLDPPERFVGREDVLAWLLKRLRAGGLASVSAVSGLGGIGKTALAGVAIRQLRAEGTFPDGIAVVRCNGLSAPSGAAVVLRRLLARFDPDGREPDESDPSRLGALARRALDGKRALVVLDNVEPELPVAEIVRPLRAAGVALLLTSRQNLPRAVVPVEASRMLELLSPEEALDLFAQTYGRHTALDLTPSERAAAERIIRALGYHTLAVKLAAASAADLGLDLTTLASDLERHPERGLKLPEDETPDGVRRAFEHSLKQLPSSAQRLFAGLAAFATPEFGRQAALAVAAGLSPEPAGEDDLNLLVRRSLLEASVNEEMDAESDRQRLRLHPLMRAYAWVLFGLWGDVEHAAAERALAAFYADYTNAIDDPALAADEANIAGALEWAHEHGEDWEIARICSGMRNYWRDRSRIQASLRYLPWGIAAAEAVAARSGERVDRLRAANIAAYYGDTLYSIGQLQAAQDIFEADLRTRQEIGDRQGEGLALSRLGDLLAQRGDLAGAQANYERDLEIMRAVGDTHGEGVVLSKLGDLLFQRGDLAGAQANYERYLDIARTMGNTRGEGVALARLGDLLVRRGDLAGAQANYERSLEIARAMEDPRGEGVVLSKLGQIAVANRQLELAEHYFQQSLQVAQAVHDRNDEGIETAYLARIAERQGDTEKAERLYREALSILRETQDALDIASVSQSLGALLITGRDKREEGCGMLAEAARLHDEMGIPGGDEIREAARRLGCG